MIDAAYQHDARRWDALKERFAAVFRSRTRDEWCAIMEGSDVCFAPVLALGEVATHSHAVARAGFFENDGIWQPAPAPRFSRTVPATPATAVRIGADTDAILAAIGYDARQIEALRGAGAVY